MQTIRPYNTSDIEQVVKLWWETWHQTFPEIKHPQSYAAWKARFENDLTIKGNIWVAVEGVIVGFMVVIEEERELNQLFVDSNYQNRGIGKALIEKAKLICPQGLTLTTLQNNTKACLFYEKHGFKPGMMSNNKINGQPNIEYS
ncbi:GNAT family N-acetyltransferase [Rivularia sp. UHCC 0363]|uniref:GNAT family N-acetyltransferase n=1 Tax=Rivularia sp. UHCC 0363 TaxID=3110244 RepID=UPI002B213D91|nr:GNAT family N-acetyltransferase [Rivularia sp. UHCC 0363]MEA5594161.1 GNAT family N-acetyltransferase [Rivularia sp. UHCC 0363]